MSKKKEITAMPAQYQSLYADIKQLISEARSTVVKQVNQTLTVTYWQIGKRISIEILDSNRAEYGKQVLRQLSQQLSDEFGKGFGYRNLLRMKLFYEYFPEQEKVTTLSSQLSWSHFVELLKLEDDIQREFYARMSNHEGWSVRTLRERMDGMLFERSAIAKQPEKVIRQELAKLEQQQTASLSLHLKDPYLLDFLDLQDNFSEKDLENAILHKLEHFILELGSDFAFMARQKRLQIGGNDYYLDLLFYHRKLKRLVLIELKLGEFKPEYKGQVELYLKWLAKHEQQADENPPIALLLCSSKDNEVIELMELEQDAIHVSEYWLQLPPKEVLRAKLHKAIEEATLRLGVGDE